MKSFCITVIITLLQLISTVLGISLYGDNVDRLWSRELETICPVATVQHGCPHLDFEHFYETENINPKFSLDLTDVRWLPNQKLYQVTIRAYITNGEKIDLKYLWSLKAIGLSMGTHQIYGFNEGVLPEGFDPSDFTTTFLIRGRPDYEECIVWLDYFQLQFEFLDGHTGQYRSDWYREGFGNSHFDLSVGCHNSNNYGQSKVGLPNYYWPLECGDADCHNTVKTSSLPPETSSHPLPPSSSSMHATFRTTMDPAFTSLATSSSTFETTSHPPPPASSNVVVSLETSNEPVSTWSTDKIADTTSSRHIIPSPIYYSSVKPAESEDRESFTARPSPVTSSLIESPTFTLPIPATASQRTQITPGIILSETTDLKFEITPHPVTTVTPVEESGTTGYTRGEMSTHNVYTFAGIANSVNPAILGSIFLNLLLVVL
ncbi:uncharacterized protein KNAG_0L02480 [Huiozyma naganishii CBS 8797]|uniref:Flo11 domain-containing protein n=1 Tax=Huiozyma naganishii (strain ATCC MYA-139 / BCRC 22969 / CBS 8797 / KCTC 17520 / NBRC 10181 / NCYC 3082 / Yp74L-3) TaxID=1071383 RepID=J7S3W7_HUIN7|nr:hypothetical protein KNAG_0L02480 [Kazachstania naganishii CBS 8797]CCK72862.1 hypothetical protein KNAG_0L02480 [Kazachstania naganishii CBS 8797]